MMPLSRQIGGLPALRVSILLAAGWTLLILACQNVVGMLIARGITRQPELAVRVALGAQRRHILRLLLMESALISVIASGVGFMLTLWAMDALKHSLPPEVLPRSGLAVDGWLLGSIVMLALLCTQMAGLSPALQVWRMTKLGTLQESGASLGRSKRTLRKLSRLVIGQTALALILVSLAMELSSSYRVMLESSRTTASSDVLTAALAAKEPAYGHMARIRLWNKLLEDAAAFPGVTDAGMTNKLPFSGGISLMVLPAEVPYTADHSQPWVEDSYVSPGYFPAIGVTLLRGRLLTADDIGGPSHSVVVINRTMAEQFWPGLDPIGRHIRPAQAEPSWSAEVIGVIEDVRQVAERPARPEMYHPYTDGPAAESYIVLRTAPGAPAPLAAMRRSLSHLDENLALTGFKSLRDTLGEQSRVFAVATSVVDGLTVAILGLAALGLYGALSFHFGQRRRDIGVRVALGASSRDIVGMILRQAASWIATGLLIGTTGAWLLWRLQNSMHSDAQAFSLQNLALSIAAILAAALIASLAPTRRALRVDPIVALRSE